MSAGIGIGVGRAGASPPWWPDDAIYAADFVTGRYMALGTEIPAVDAFSFGRASEAMARHFNGQWQLFPENAPAITEAGIHLEEALEYQPQNSLLQGCVVGTLGSGGSLPTGWHVITSGGLTTRVDSLGQEGDAPFVRLHVHGVSAADYQLGFDGNTTVAAPGETWCTSVATRLVSTTSTVADPYIRCVEQNSASFLAATEVEIPWQGSFARRTATRLFASPTVNRVKARLRLSTPPGAIDIVFDAALPCTARDAGAPSPGLTGPTSPWLRQGDALTLNLPDVNSEIRYYHGTTLVFQQDGNGPLAVSPADIPGGLVTSILGVPK